MSSSGGYARIIAEIFAQRYSPGDREVPFERDDIVSTAAQLGIDLPKNLGDLVYTFRHRRELPDSIRSCAPEGEHWIIRPVGTAKYCFALTGQAQFRPNEHLVAIKIPDATPGVIDKYAFNDEQALLAKLRYNRLIDIFTGVTCYSLQNHLRTNIKGIGQIETDELYIGIDRAGAHYVFPVQAKGGRDMLGTVQIEQDFALCAERFADLICRPIAAQFMSKGQICLFSFVQADGVVGIANERHYELVPPDSISPEELSSYATNAQLEP